MFMILSKFKISLQDAMYEIIKIPYQGNFDMFPSNFIRWSANLGDQKIGGRDFPGGGAV